ncbi:hypothetical protein UY416_01805 [Paenibacillus polymyxa]|uniref:hypothetical protein n=1 Tax=Paenibacillus polymyxa TaxID=1406 RepID=UPI002AB36446|nr:hypothetical protein [Paenibacillus polymyxa]MDY8045028.1 hypothetical protein [Paenibacillus polymyxa]
MESRIVKKYKARTNSKLGFQMGSRITKEPVLSALERAYLAHHPASEVLHHSDRGSQYTAQEHQKKLVNTA